jgi:hypothetical protein
MESAAKWLAEHYEWDRSGRGYIDRKSGLLALITQVMEAYATARIRAIADILLEIANS